MQQYREVGDLGQLQAEAQMAHEATRKELEDFRREMRALSAEARAGAEEVVAQLKGRLETVLSREAALAARIEEVRSRGACQRADGRTTLTRAPCTPLPCTVTDHACRGPAGVAGSEEARRGSEQQGGCHHVSPGSPRAAL